MVALATQAAAAGGTFIGWFLLSVRLSPAEQYVPVQAYAWGSVIALVLGMGFTQTIANHFRGAVPAALRNRGPWSLGATMVVVTSALAAIVGGAAIPAARNASIISASCSMAAGLSMGQLIAQFGRWRGSRAVLVLGLAFGPFVPLLWIACTVLGAGERVLLELLWCAAAAYLLLGSLSIRGALAPLRSLATRRGLREVRGSAPLLPHMLAWGALMQAPRIMVGLLGTPIMLAEVQRLMLSVNAGQTVIANFHTVRSVTIQAADEVAYRARANRFVIEYIVLGALSATVPVIAWRLMDRVAGVGGSAASLFAIGAAPVLLAGYYSASAVLVRARMLTTLSILSTSGLAVYAFAEIVVGPGVTFSMVMYAAVLASLAVGAAIAARGVGGGLRTSGLRMTVLPLSIVTGAVSVALGAL